MTTPGDEIVARLERKLGADAHTCARLDRYYEGRVRLASIGLALPPEMRLSTVVNWPALYVDALEERLYVEGFRLDGAADADDRLWEWWQANDLDEESQLAHLDALTYGRSFVTVGAAVETSAPPVIRIESARSMAAEFDPHTHRITAALQLYNPDETTDPETLGPARSAALYPARPHRLAGPQQRPRPVAGLRRGRARPGPTAGGDAHQPRTRR